VSLLQNAAETLEARKLAALGYAADADAPATMTTMPAALLSGTDVSASELLAFGDLATRNLLAQGLGTHTVPALVASAWTEGFLLGLYAGQLTTP
jgi:hypothetical protein